MDDPAETSHSRDVGGPTADIGSVSKVSGSSGYSDTSIFSSESHSCDAGDLISPRVKWLMKERFLNTRV